MHTARNAWTSWPPCAAATAVIMPAPSAGVQAASCSRPTDRAANGDPTGIPAAKSCGRGCSHACGLRVPFLMRWPGYAKFNYPMCKSIAHVVGRDANYIDGQNRGARLSEITDGLSNTFLCGERALQTSGCISLGGIWIRRTIHFSAAFEGVTAHEASVATRETDTATEKNSFAPSGLRRLHRRNHGTQTDRLMAILRHNVGLKERTPGGDNTGVAGGAQPGFLTTCVTQLDPEFLATKSMKCTNVVRLAVFVVRDAV